MTTHFNTKPTHNFSIYISNKLLILLIFAMASISYLFYFLFVVAFSVKGDILDHYRVRTRLGAASTDRIKQACKSTRYPDPCNSMLTQPGRPQVGPDPAEVIQLAISISQDNLKGGQAMIQNILEASTGNANRSNAAKTCLEMLSYSSTRSSMASDALSRAMLRDSRAWLSAALAYQYDCWSGLKYVNDTSLVNQTMSYFDTVMILSTSNALSMLRAMDVFGPDTTKWVPPITERDGFWEPVVGSGTGSETIGFGSLDGLNVDVEVCKDGGACKYTTIQEAVDSAPENLEWKNKYVIKIKEGIYEETIRVGFNKKHVVFLGDGVGKTVITGSLNTGLLGINTYHTATVGVLGDGFMASGITFQNTAGPEAHQAVAFRSDSDFSYVENCEFLGNQDTIYIHTLRQLFKSCRIEGNVDFIFGNAAAIFENCIILVRPRQLHPEKGETNSISAHGRTDPTQTTGFSFIGCFINGTQDYMTFYHQKPSRHKNYLGRPWKLYSRTVYINCTMESLIHPDGWLPWTGDFALNTLYYGEYGNSGPGANMSNRVPWSRQIPAEHVPTFYVQNFLQGDEWIARSS